MTNKTPNITNNSIPSLDTLYNDKNIVLDTVSSFLREDTARCYQELPIHKISEMESLLPDGGNWFTLTVLGLLFYLILARFLFSFNLVESFFGLYKIQTIDNVGFEKETIFSGYILSPLAIFVYAYYLYFVINPKYLHIQLDYLFLVFSLIMVVLFFLKTIIEKTISIIFNTQETFKQYFTDHLYILGVSSILQAFLIFVYNYSKLEVFLWVSIGILVLLWILRLVRGFIIGINETTFSKSFIILYLCSLEILPLIIALKLVIG